MSLGYELARSRRLRIRLAYLEAIEAGTFQRSSGAPMRHGFLRTYAEHLGLDPSVLRRFKEETSGGLTAQAGALPAQAGPGKPHPAERCCCWRPGGLRLWRLVLHQFDRARTGRLRPGTAGPLASALNIAPAAPAPGLVVPSRRPSRRAGVRPPPAAPSPSPPPAVAAAPRAHPDDRARRRSAAAAAATPGRTGRGRRGRAADRQFDAAQRSALGQAAASRLSASLAGTPDRWRDCRSRRRRREHLKRGRATPALWRHRRPVGGSRPAIQASWHPGSATWRRSADDPRAASRRRLPGARQGRTEDQTGNAGGVGVGRWRPPPSMGTPGSCAARTGTVGGALISRGLQLKPGRHPGLALDRGPCSSALWASGTVPLL